MNLLSRTSASAVSATSSATPARAYATSGDAWDAVAPAAIN